MSAKGIRNVNRKTFTLEEIHSGINWSVLDVDQQTVSESETYILNKQEPETVQGFCPHTPFIATAWSNPKMAKHVNECPPCKAKWEQDSR